MSRDYSNCITTVGEVADAIEQFAPLSTQASYDNSGLIVGRPSMLVGGVLLAVDLTEEVLSEALEEGCNMIVTHHPIIFSPLKRLNSASYIERCVERAIRHDVAIYAAHTNLDSAVGGMSWRLGSVLGLEKMEVLEASSQGSEVGFGVVGELAEAIAVEEFLDRIAQRLSVDVMRHSEVVSPTIRRVAVCTGSGGSLLASVVARDCDLYVTADLRYNDFLDAQKCVTVVDIGHFESEYCAIEILNDLLSKKMINFAVRASRKCANPVHYSK
ncbi:MAG: Nif3-like dinuclear metal center hexameric protein [Rikenellaceae bacterium]